MTGLARHIPEIAVRWARDEPGRQWSVREGTLCFADVSGFTALAERLARQGRIGGEELIETLGRIFGGMLEVARGQGGMLLKFGGDALFFMFEGEGHALRAAAAAVEMRAALRAAAALPTSVGPLRLAMSVGLHSGPIHLFLVGSPHRELVVAGPAVTTVLAMEAAAAAGEVAVSPATAALLPPSAVRSRPDGVQLLRWRRRARAGWHPAEPAIADRDLLRALFPAALADWLEAGPPEPEHRVACIAFVRFSGTDQLLATDGPAAVAAVLQATLTTAQASWDAEGITLLAIDVDRDGGKLFLGAGVPRASEDDEGRMLRALRRLVDASPPLPLQAGVSRGYVFAAELGTPWRAAYSAMGDTTNTAARICAKAPPGAIYAHPAVLEAARTLFDATPEGPFLFKGKAAAQVLYQVGAESGTRVREAAATLPLRGRDAELAALRAHASRLVSGTGGIVVLEAGMGLGKSRLLREALDGLPGVTRQALRAEPYGVRAPYRLLRDPLRRLLGIVRGDQASMRGALESGLRRVDPALLPWASLVGDVAHIEVDPSPEVALLEPRFRPERTAELLVRLIAAGAPGPLALIVDDAQWVDEASCLVLGRIAEETSARPWLLCVARRPGPEGFRPPGCDAVMLEPLDPAASHALVRAATAAAPLRPFEADLVVERGGGNPLFLEEILQARRESGSADALPVSLEAAIAAQIDGLDADARQLVRQASVLGNSFRPTMLEAFVGVAGGTFDATALARAEALLVADRAGYLRFRRPLVRDTAYAGLAFRVRRHLHQAAGEAIEALVVEVADSVDLLATHFAAAGDAVRTWRYARLGAARARRAGANPAAAGYYRMALDASRRLPDVAAGERAAVWTELGHACQLAGLYDDALGAFRAAARLSGDDPVARADLRRLCGVTRERAGEFAAATREIGAGRRLLAGRDSPAVQATRARLDALGAMVCFAQQRYGLALRRARTAEAAARRAGDALALAEALVAADSAELSLGGHATARMQEALGIYVSLGDVPSEAMVRGNLGCAAYLGGRWDEALQWFGGDRNARERIGDVVGSAIASANVGEILTKRGQFAEAEPVLCDAIRILRASGFVDGAAYSEVQLARVLVGLRRHDEATAILLRVGAEFARLGQLASALEVAVVAVAACTDLGKLPAALERLDQAAAVAGEGGRLLVPQVAEARARALQVLGRVPEAAAVIEAGLSAARRLGARYEEALLLRARGQAAATAGGADCRDLADSREILAGLGALAPEAGNTGTKQS